MKIEIMRTYNDIMKTILSIGIVENIGQIEKADLRLLDNAVKKGIISKGKGGFFPALKTVYAPKGFDFIAHRNAVISLLRSAQKGTITGMEYILYKWDYKKFIK